jgi:hypothetical protein
MHLAEYDNNGDDNCVGKIDDDSGGDDDEV